MTTTMQVTMALCAALTLARPLGAQARSARAAIESVKISTPDGSMLAGRYRDAGRGAPGVLLFPMCSPSGVDGWTPVAERLAAAGVSSLMMAEVGYGPDGAREARGGSAVAYLRLRVGQNAPVALTGASCGVALALGTAARHPERVRAVVLLSGPYDHDQLAHVRKTPSLAVFSGASERESPTPDWARALKLASANPASRVELWKASAHGTDYFALNPSFAQEIVDWLVQRLKAPSSR